MSFLVNDNLLACLQLYPFALQYALEPLTMIMNGKDAMLMSSWRDLAHLDLDLGWPLAHSLTNLGDVMLRGVLRARPTSCALGSCA